MIKDLPHPFTREIETCKHLVNYCHQLKRKAGLEIDNDAAAKQLQQAQLVEATQKKLDDKMSAGKLMESSGNRDADNFT